MKSAGAKRSISVTVPKTPALAPAPRIEIHPPDSDSNDDDDCEEYQFLLPRHSAEFGLRGRRLRYEATNVKSEDKMELLEVSQVFLDEARPPPTEVSNGSDHRYSLSLDVNNVTGQGINGQGYVVRSADGQGIHDKQNCVNITVPGTSATTSQVISECCTLSDCDGQCSHPNLNDCHSDRQCSHRSSDLNNGNNEHKGSKETDSNKENKCTTTKRPKTSVSIRKITGDSCNSSHHSTGRSKSAKRFVVAKPNAINIRYDTVNFFIICNVICVRFDNSIP